MKARLRRHRPARAAQARRVRGRAAAVRAKRAAVIEAPRDVVTGVDAEGELLLPHACELEQSQPEIYERWLDGQGRLLGLDVARFLAVIGMMVVHLVVMTTDEGTRSLSWVLCSGNASALFALLAGVGIGLTTGREVPPRSWRWAEAACSLLVRMVFIGVLGLALGSLVPSGTASIILPTYAVLFALLIPFTRLRAKPLIVIGGVLVLLAPIVSHVLRAEVGYSVEAVLGFTPNLVFASLFTDPRAAVLQVLLTGTFPVLTWFPYTCIGLGIGRSPLGERRVAAKLLAIGIGLAIAAQASYWLLMDVFGGQQRLADIASRSMDLEDFTDLLVWGAGGALPIDSWWWEAVLAPHTATPLDLLFTTGVACAVLGGCLIAGRVLPNLLAPLAVLGSMPLSAYAAHLLLLNVSLLPDSRWGNFLAQLVALLLGAFLWRVWYDKGPMEMLLGACTGEVKRAFRPPGARAIR